MNNQAFKSNIKISNHYLTESDFKKVFMKLNLERKTIQKEKIKLMNQLDVENCDKCDFIDRANREHDIEIDSLLIERDNITLQKIDDAIYRIRNDDEFGYCNCCGEEIGLNRLLVRPYTKECIDCKSLKEMDQMQASLKYR